MPQYRREKIADQLHAFLAEELRRLSDPRLQFVTLTALQLAADYKSAKLYWSAIPQSFPREDDEKAPQSQEERFLNEKEVEEISAALGKARGLLKRRVGEELKLRHVPELIFIYDESIETGMRIDALLDSLAGPEGRSR